MKYYHTLLKTEIKDGRLYCVTNSLDSESRTWFEKHSGKTINIFKDGLLVRRNAVLSRYKQNSWRFNCGVDTFKGLQPGDTITIKERSDGNLEISVAQQPEETTTRLPSSFIEPTISRSISIPNRRQKQPLLGEPLNFRGLQHAPINEQGVVFLFGMVCRELGYLIEAVQTGFPDSEGKRRVDKQRWQRVRIEFEFQSSNFLKHGHDAELCDLVVCWEHDWRECPLEVLELSKEIQKLDNNL